MNALLSFVLFSVVMTARLDKLEAVDSPISDTNPQEDPSQLRLPVVLQYVAEEDDTKTYASFHNTVQTLQKLQDLGATDRLVLFTKGISDMHLHMLTRHATTMVPVSKLDIETSGEQTISATKLQSFGLTVFERVVYLDSNPSLLEGTNDLKCLESSCDGPVCTNGKLFGSNSAIMVLEPNDMVLEALKGMNELGDVLLPEKDFFHELFSPPTSWKILPEECFGEVDDGLSSLQDHLARIKLEDEENVPIERVALVDGEDDTSPKESTAGPPVVTIVAVTVSGLLVLGLAFLFVASRRRRITTHVVLIDEDEDYAPSPTDLSTSHFQIPLTADEEVSSLAISSHANGGAP